MFRLCAGSGVGDQCRDSPELEEMWLWTKLHFQPVAFGISFLVLVLSLAILQSRVLFKLSRIVKVAVKHQEVEKPCR